MAVTAPAPPKCEACEKWWNEAISTDWIDEAKRMAEYHHALLAAKDAQIAELRALVDDILRDNYDDKEWTRRAEAVLARKEGR